MRAVWPDRIVTEQSLFQCVAEIRAACGKDAIRTVSGRGYQWRPVSPPLWRSPRVALSAAVSAAGILLAVWWAQDGSVGPEPAPSMTIAILPGANTDVALERALVQWVSSRIPATLTTGADAVDLAGRRAADVAVAVWRDAAAYGYRITTPTAEVDGRLGASDTLHAAADIGAVISETLIREQLVAAAGEDRLLASHRAALTYLMAGDVRAAEAYTKSVLAVAPEYLPARGLQVQLALAGDRPDFARAEAERILQTGRAQNRTLWTSTGYLSMADVDIVEGRLAAATDAAERALEVARLGGQQRQAGKAAEQLAAIRLRQHRESDAMTWLIAAHRFYAAARCTVGTARVDRKVRELRAGRESPARSKA